MKDQDIKDILDKNFMFLTMLGYSTSIIFEMQRMIENGDAYIDDRLQEQIDWFKTAIENIVYKNIAAPKMP